MIETRFTPNEQWIVRIEMSDTRPPTMRERLAALWADVAPALGVAIVVTLLVLR